MIADDLSTTRTLLDGLSNAKRLPIRDRVLMVSPEFFDVKYAINPYMTDSAGRLQKVNLDSAVSQWLCLKQAYENLGFKVDVLAAHPELPDMVFAANQSFPFWDFHRGRPSVLLSRMKSPFRRPEVEYFGQWYEKRGYEVHGLHHENLAFEGNGDASLHPRFPLVIGGYGQRTDKDVYDQFPTRFGLSVVRLALNHPDYYHLDTCFSILNDTTVAIQPNAFTTIGMEIIHKLFDRVIPIEDDENIRFFSANCHCPNGTDVVLQKGSRKFISALEKEGFRVHPVDTSEFIKSGGSVFCLKMMVY